MPKKVITSTQYFEMEPGKSSLDEDPLLTANANEKQPQTTIRFDENVVTKPKAASTRVERIMPVNIAPLRPSLLRHVTSGGYPLEPMSRDYPRPAAEPSIDELLSRPPLKGTFSYNLKKNKNLHLETNMAKEKPDPDGLARAKQHWLRIAEELKDRGL